MYDLLIKDGTLVDPGQGIREKKDLAIEKGRIASIATEISPELSRAVLNAADHLVKKEAKDFLRFLHRHDIYSRYMAMMPNGFQPQRRSTFKDPTYLNDPRVKQVAQFLDAGAESLQFCSTPGNDQVMNPYGSEIESRLLLKKVVDLVLVDGKSPAEAAATGQKWIEELVQEIGK